MRRIRKVFTCLVFVSGVSVFFFFLASEKERVKGKNIVHLKGILIVVVFVVVIFVSGGGGDGRSWNDFFRVQRVYK